MHRNAFGDHLFMIVSLLECLYMLHIKKLKAEFQLQPLLDSSLNRMKSVTDLLLNFLELKLGAGT